MKAFLMSLVVIAGVSTASADWAERAVDASAAWSQGLYGDGVVIALVGTGVDLIHPRIQDAIFQNPGELGFDAFGNDKRFNNFDDDGNGFADDWAGWNFAANSGNRVPAIALGTQLAGIITAQHRDESDVDGVLQGIAPGAKILPVGFIEDNGSAQVENVFKAIDYAVMRGAKIINASWNLGEDVPGLREKILELDSLGILFVSSAGNDSRNIDESPRFPASYNFAHQLTVGHHTELESKVSTTSNFGKNSVHLMAPGENIVSTMPNNGMGEVNGSAAATAYVSAVAAILWQHRPEANSLNIIEAILRGVRSEASYDNLCWTEGRINVGFAIQEIERLFPDPSSAPAQNQ